MEQVFVVRLKSRPARTELYPSERRYSASTAGGLGLVHGLLAATLLVLAALGMRAEPPRARVRYAAAVALGVAAAGAAAAAVLAWRRWYVDNNIRHFLVAAGVAGVAALACLCLTALALAAVHDEISLRQHGVATPRDAATPLGADTRFDVGTLDNVTVASQEATSYNATDADDAGDADDGWASAREDNATLGTPSEREASGRPWIDNYESFQEIRRVVLWNVMVAAGLELAWSLLSVRIAWRGVRNAYTDPLDVHPHVHPHADVKSKQPRGPDIIRHLGVGVGVGVGVDRDLPQGESSVEFEERVRRFLAASDAAGGRVGRH